MYSPRLSTHFCSSKLVFASLVDVVVSFLCQFSVNSRYSQWSRSAQKITDGHIQFKNEIIRGTHTRTLTNTQQHTKISNDNKSSGISRISNLSADPERKKNIDRLIINFFATRELYCYIEHKKHTHTEQTK